MSTTYGSEQGTVYILDEADAVRKKVRSAVTDSGAEVRRGPDKAGITNLIEILAAVRDVAPEEVEREFEGSGYGDFKSAVAEAVVEYLAPVRERYAELRADEAGARGDPRRRAPRRRGRSPPRRSPTCATRWASGRRRQLAVRRPTSRLCRDESRRARPRPRRLRRAVRPADGGRPARGGEPAEVELGEIVVAYLEHLEERGRARPRGGDRVPGPDRLAAGAEVAAAAAGARGRRAGARARGGGRRAARADARVPPLPRRRRAPRRAASRTGARYLYRSAPLPPELRRVSLDAATPGRTSPTGSPRRSATCCATPPEPDTSHIRPTVSLERRLRAAARAARRAAGSFDFDEAFGDEDRLTQAVTLFALLEMHKRGRGDLGAEEALRADRGGGRDRVSRRRLTVSSGSSRRCCSSRPSRSRPRSSPRRARRARPRSTGRSTLLEGALAEGSAGSSCARSPAATRSPPTRPPRTPRAACWRSRARRR